MAARNAASTEFELLTLNRDRDGSLAVANGFDLLVDVIPYERRHAEHHDERELDGGQLRAGEGRDQQAQGQGGDDEKGGETQQKREASGDGDVE